MIKHYLIQKMDQKEVNMAVDWAEKEGWNPGIHDAFCFYQTDPNGFFAGKLDNKIIAVGSAVIYDEYFAFCGFYIVDKKYRNQGYGLLLTKARLAYTGTRNVGIDGVINMLDKYSRIGYQFAHNNARYLLESPPYFNKVNPHIVPLNQINFTELCNYDRLHFPAMRTQFLNYWICQKQSMTLAYVLNGQLKGYGVIRTCVQGFKIAPLFADTPEIAQDLFEMLAQFAHDNPIFLDIPENNPFAIKLVKRYKMKKIFATARMYLKDPPQLATEQIYGITSFELG